MKLLTSAVTGIFTTLFLFIICFLLVHIFILAKIGWNTKTSPQPPANEEKPKEKKSSTVKKNVEREPVYYIVERKKPRAKHSYSEPKEIRFK